MNAHANDVPARHRPCMGSVMLRGTPVVNGDVDADALARQQQQPTFEITR